MDPNSQNNQPAPQASAPQPAPPQQPAPVVPTQQNPPLQQPVQSPQPYMSVQNMPSPQTQPNNVLPQVPSQQYASLPTEQQTAPQIVGTQQSVPKPPAAPTNLQTPSAAAQNPQQQAVQNIVAATDTSVQDGMRKTVLKIIAALTTLSLAAVSLLFLISGTTDSSLLETSTAANDQASYSIPASWSVDNKGTFDAYYNQATLESSQATLLVVDPVRISFDSERVSDAAMLNLAAEYRRSVNEGEGDLVLAEASEVAADGFYLAFDYEVSGTADDGKTQIQGVSRLLFDDNNFAHTLEFVAIKSYWDANQSEIRRLIDSYSLKAGQ